MLKRKMTKQNKIITCKALRNICFILTNEYDFFLHNHKIFIFASTSYHVVKAAKTESK